LVSIVILFIFTRIMGKKQLSQLSFFDYIAGISIGSIAGEFAINHEIPYEYAIVALVVYSVIPIAVSYISLKGKSLRGVLGDKPSILIQNGKFLEKNLRKSKFTINDVLEECRLKDIFDIRKVDYAILETSGKVSILLKPENQLVTLKDMKIKSNYKGIMAEVIVDGIIMNEHLKLMNHNEQWLFNELKKLKINSPKEVFLATVDATGKLNVDLKDNDPEPFNVFK
ncbi:DUF421 domain-containing protein, partial [Clostridium sp.]|uniref:DUF421 domain-containing protein n=1 Tax=Clostridium sp. TaxID=1506 RepID=UPI003463A25A